MLGNKRSGGILLHPTSLPGPFWIGDLGPSAHEFVEWLADAGCGLWQVLPLGPTGYGNSPYQCHSVFAGNPLLISPELLRRDGFLTADDLSSRTMEAGAHSAGRVDYGAAIASKMSILELAFRRFQAGATLEQKAQFEQFRTEHAAWLEDFSLFMAIKEQHRGISWIHWPEGIRLRETGELRRSALILEEMIGRWCFYQMLFLLQWGELREHAGRLGIALIGDVPIFAAEDSADVWAHPEFFRLDSDGRATAVSGVPPDYFSPTGQLWGNPLYDWETHRRTGYEWWLQRLHAVLRLVDIVRIDHFRGLAGYWEVPAGARNAVDGSWMPGPGADLLDAFQAELRRATDSESIDLPLIAEDLGVVTPDVIGLLDRYRLPGMRVLQFGFAGLSDEFLPHNYVRDCVVYTGTHDNDTSRGWFAGASREQQDFALQYLRSTEERVVQDMIRANWESPAAIAIVPLQDLLGLGGEARMNLPGRPQGNWEWRCERSALGGALADWMLRLNEETGRTSKARTGEAV